jgi:glycosyltransferase involved in cell wall biosynthesis
MVTVVIPVYNKAPYLRRCLDSVLVAMERLPMLYPCQVVVVDDASTDGSGAICDEYAAKMEIHHLQRNVGVSEARNFGMRLSKGDYITFLDADDALTPEALVLMEDEALKGYNIVQFGKLTRRGEEHAGVVYTNERGRYGLENIPKYWVTVWNKMYSRAFLTRNRVQFPAGMSFGEDTIFNIQAIIANRGLYQARGVSVVHFIDDKKSLCRGQLDRSKIEKLDRKMCAWGERCKDETELAFVTRSINEHRGARIYTKYGYKRGPWSPIDVVYFVRSGDNEELRYSLRSVTENWPHRRVVFYGGRPTGLEPDLMVDFDQPGLTKWDKVRETIRVVCMDDRLTDDIWLFNDDFFVLKPDAAAKVPTYNGELEEYAANIEQRQGHGDAYTARLRIAAQALREAGYRTLNYEVHKPMLINRKRALEVLEKFPDTPCFRSLYGNYWSIGGARRHDMKLKVLREPSDEVKTSWEFVSTSDKSFAEGGVGRFIRGKFERRSRYETEE